MKLTTPWITTSCSLWSRAGTNQARIVNRRTAWDFTGYFSIEHPSEHALRNIPVIQFTVLSVQNIPSITQNKFLKTCYTDLTIQKKKHHGVDDSNRKLFISNNLKVKNIAQRTNIRTSFTRFRLEYFVHVGELKQ